MLNKKYQQNIFVFLGILVLALLLFWPTLEADFVNWDDKDYIYDNPVLLENDWSQPVTYLKDIFSQQLRSIYSPLTTLSYAIEKGIYGLDQPGWWHLDNILLHALNSLLVFLILGRLGISLNVALLTTLLFVIHPMRVESVAWLTARKDLLFTLFFFLGLLAYLKKSSDKDKKVGYAIAVWVFFFLSLLSKVLAVTFPLVLVLIDIYRDREIKVKSLLYKLPYFLLAFAFGVLSIYLANSYETIQVETPEFNFIDRLALASTALSTYLVKFFYPYEMMPLYPYPKEIATQAYALIAIPILVGGLWLWSLWEKQYLLFFGIGFFLVNIIFSLQLIPVGQGFKADRYPYIAYLGFFLLLATVVMNTLEKNWKQGRFLVLIPALLFLLLYGPMTFQQAKIWKSSQTLWSHQMKYTPENPTPYKNLADYFRYNNDPDREYQYLQQAFQLDAEDPGISYRMGMLIFEQPQFGTVEEALTWLNKSIESDASYVGAYVNRAVLLARLGRNTEALADLQRAEQLDNSNPDIYLNRAVILNSLGSRQEAIKSLDQYLTLRPRDTDKWVIKAQLHNQLQQYQVALQAVEKGLALDPNNATYQATKANIIQAMNANK